MKTISEQQATEQFNAYSKLAHEGEKVLITRQGEPWVMLVPPAVPHRLPQATQLLQWPDFTGRLAKYYPQPVSGPTATELLAQDKEDRF